ncbi:MAG: M15 family metallopeptidase [Clostridiaceae bacterium]
MNEKSSIDYKLRKKKRSNKRRRLKVLAIIMILFSFLFIFKDEAIDRFFFYRAEAAGAYTDRGILLVNDSYVLDKKYKPGSLRKVNIDFVGNISSEEKYLTEAAAEAVEEMFAKAQKEGIILVGSSGYRSYKSQKDIYLRDLAAKGEEYVSAYVAVPGSSEHQTGLAIDITNEASWMTGESTEARWLRDNCHLFGFILRYPEGKEHITGKSYEPWHLRYVGKEAAEEIYAQGITLEEYMGVY